MRDALGRVDHVAVFGGTSDLGGAIAARLVEERGAREVVLVGRDTSRLEEAAGALRDRGATVVVVPGFDAAEPDGHARVVDRVCGDRELDVVLLAFGVLGRQTKAEQDPAEAVRVARVNYLGAVSVGLHLARVVERQGHGDLVVLSSVAGDRARRENYVYGSSKAGLDAFAQGLGDRLVPAGGHVLVVRPGFVHTAMTAGREPAPLATTPAAVARDVVAALDRRAEVVYSPRVLRWLMAVLRHLPRGLFRRLVAR